MSDSSTAALWRAEARGSWQWALAHRPRQKKCAQIQSLGACGGKPTLCTPASVHLPTNAMAKKRKASGQLKPSKGDAQSSKLAISTYQDVADSEDEFHINRDKILLDEGPEAKRQRKWQEKGMRPWDCAGLSRALQLTIC